MKTKNIIGIDVSKDKLSLFNSSDKSFVEVSNTKESLLEYITKNSLKNSKYKVGLESTGDYSYLATKFFVEKDFETILINPIITKRYIKSSVRGKKTDRNDAEIIVKIVEDNEGKKVTKEGLDTSKKVLLRAESNLIGIRSDLKRFKKSLELKKSNGIKVSSVLTEVERLIDEITLSAKIVFEEAVSGGQTRQEEIIDSLPGCAIKTSAVISSEAGDISRFDKAKEFVAYAGLDPKVSQSGNKLYLGRITKRGNPYLRKSLYQAAHVARMYDPEMKAFYEKKMSEGKHYKTVICAVARKLCLRIYSVVKEDRLYEVRPLEAVSLCKLSNI